MGILWIVTGNRSFAKILEVQGHGRKIKEIYHLVNPEGRMKSGEILSDRPGRAYDRVGGGRHALSQEVDFHEHEQHVFVHKIANLLREQKDNNAFEELAFVAPSHFLGDLNQAISPSVKKSLIKEVAKDLPEYLSSQELVDQLCKYLDLWNHAQ